MALFRQFFLLGTFVVWSSASLAGPILQGSPTAATGFLNLNIEVLLYNATFHGNDSFFDVFDVSSPLSEITFYQNPAGAESAANALAQALNDNSVSGISDFIPRFEYPYPIVGIPYDYFSDSRSNVYINTYFAVYDPDSNAWYSEATAAPLGSEGYVFSLVSFERAEVPAPSTLLLIMMALAIFLRDPGRRLF